MICPICSKEYVRDKFHPRQKTCGNSKCYRVLYGIEHHEKIQKVNKYYREKKWFGGNRDVVLKRDGFKCTECGSTRVAVHHRDGKGRGYVGVVDNSPANLVTLCSVCHAKLHGIQRSKVNKRYYQMEVAKRWDMSDRQIGGDLGITHPTVAEIRRLLRKRWRQDGS